jgi:hypothetical protein
MKYPGTLNACQTDADPDQAHHFDEDPDRHPAYHFDADPILTFNLMRIRLRLPLFLTRQNFEELMAL